MEKFINYRLIDELNGNIVYFLSINDEETDHEERLEAKKNQMAQEKRIPYCRMFWERWY